MKYWVAQVEIIIGILTMKIFRITFEKYACKIDRAFPSIIILDRASYHKKFPDYMFFPSKTKKNELKVWLDEENIRYNPEKSSS